jgi:hypothetical protein
MKLLDDGFVHDARTLLRTIAEATVYFHEAMANKDFKEAYRVEDVDRVRRLNNRRIELETITKGTVSQETQNEAEAAQKQWRQLREGKLDLGTLAKNHNCINEYFVFHALNHPFVHSLPNAISKYFTYDKDANKVEWIQMPGEKDIADVMAACAFCLLKVASSINRDMALGHDESIAVVDKAFLKTVQEEFAGDEKPKFKE